MYCLKSREGEGGGGEREEGRDGRTEGGMEEGMGRKIPSYTRDNLMKSILPAIHLYYSYST